MTIQDGQLGNANVTNAAFLSKTDETATNTATGVIGLNNTSDSESGPSIANIQKAINENSNSFRVVQSISASGQIDVDERIMNHLLLVVGDGGDIVTSTTPFNPENGGSFQDGTIITVIGTNDSQRVRINNVAVATDVTVQNGDANLALNFCITYMRVTIGGTSYWLERSRNI